MAERDGIGAEISLEITAESKDTIVRNYVSGERRVGVCRVDAVTPIHK